MPRFCYVPGGEDERFCRPVLDFGDDSDLKTTREGVVDLIFCALALRHVVSPAAHYAQGVSDSSVGRKSFDGTGAPSILLLSLPPFLPPSLPPSLHLLFAARISVDAYNCLTRYSGLGVGAGELARVQKLGIEASASSGEGADLHKSRSETERREEGTSTQAAKAAQDSSISTKQKSEAGLVAERGDRECSDSGLYAKYVALFSGFLNGLAPGGHVIVGDHVGHLSAFEHCLALRAAGFVDVEVAWKERDFFVLGGRKGTAHGIDR